jgi:N,N'-diacetyl-8-epilegionaminate cytidylyltransferase
MTSTHAFVFARGGSKGVPGKNIRPFAGRPLIAHTIELALRMPEISKVILSTDDPDIAAVGRQYGAVVPFLRPAELSGDNSPEWKAWQHAVSHVRDVMGEPFDCFVSLPATSPLRSEADVRACLNRYAEGSADIVIGVTPAANNPYFNMIQLAADGRAELVIKPEGKVIRRQDAPDVFNITTCAYVTSPDFILSHNGIFDGVLKTALIPNERAIDIDTPLDFEFAEFLFRKHHPKD